MKKIMKGVIQGVILLACLNLLYLAFMTLAFSVPVTDRVRQNVERSMEIFVAEKRDPPLFDDGNIISTTLFADLIWIDTALQQEENAFYMAIALPHKEQPYGDMWSPEDGFYGLMVPVLYYYDAPETQTLTYARFWMLAAGAVRLLLHIMHWGEIRYLFFTIAAALLLYIACRLYERCGWRGLLPFGTAVIMRNLLFHTVSLTTSTDSILTFISVAVVLTVCDKDWYLRHRYLYYLGLGSLTYAIGTLHAPLLTLGMTLLTEVLIREYGHKDTLPAESDQTFSYASLLLVSFLWASGYAVTIIAKGAAAKAVLGSAGEGGSMLLHYISSHGGGIGIRLYRIIYCLNKLFSPQMIKLPLLLVILIVLIVMMYKRGIRKVTQAGQIMMIALYPVVWVMIVVEHSIHNYASNIFSILIYGVVALLCGMIRDRR